MFRLAEQPVIAFVATTDPERARAFYRDQLGLTLVSDELPFALVFDVNGVMLRITAVRDLQPAGYTILGWKVEDIRAAVSAMQGRGVAFERYSGMEQDELGIWDAPGGAAKVAWFRDPDGNTLSLSEHTG